MEYTSKERKNDLVKFMNNVNSELRKKDKVYNNLSQLFDSKLLSSGIEGKVYKSTFKYPNYGQMILVVKTLELLSIKKSKKIPSKIFKLSTDELYDLFKSETDYNQNSLIELIAQSLTNQLIFQKICPHYSLNYYWDYDSKKKIISSYNEYANAESFHSWAQRKYTDDIWFNALFQIIYALVSLKRYYNMSHTDFHTDNILVHKVKPGGFWVYTLNDVKYYLPNLGFVFLLHDFGFAWIPQKLVVNWHNKDTLKYITNIGKEFYDLACFIDSLKRDYKLPKYFEWFINNNFFSEEIDYVLSKNYYRDFWNYIKDNDSISTKLKNEFKKQYVNYPSINKSYKGNKMTLEKKFNWLFNDKNSHDFSRFSNANQFIYTNKINGKPIDRYSSDKYLNKKKLPKNLQKLAIL